MYLVAKNDKKSVGVVGFKPSVGGEMWGPDLLFP